jgi:hypothetical protein
MALELDSIILKRVDSPEIGDVCKQENGYREHLALVRKNCP